MAFSPIVSKSKNEQVREIIVDQIVTGAWPPGGKIPGELALAKQFAVSRVAIRQAISQLVGQGILTVRQGDGTFVNSIMPSNYFANLKQLVIMETPEYYEVQYFRLMFEPSIAYYVAENATPEQIAALEECVRVQQEYKDRFDIRAYTKEDSRFHTLLAESSGNRLVVTTRELVSDLMDVAMEHTAKVTGYTNGVEYHRRILEEIKKRKPGSAAEVMRKHIKNNIRDFDKYSKA